MHTVGQIDRKPVLAEGAQNNQYEKQKKLKQGYAPNCPDVLYHEKKIEEEAFRQQYTTKREFKKEYQRRLEHLQQTGRYEALKHGSIPLLDLDGNRVERRCSIR